MKRTLFTTDDGSVSIKVPELEETYHSKFGAITESMHVFINSGLKCLNQKEIRIWEMGFGTGLNAYLSWIYAKKNKFRIDYHSLEKFPLTKDEIDILNFSEQLEQSQHTFDRLHSVAWDEKHQIDEHFNLLKTRGDLRNVTLPSNCDLIFYDAFGPDIQPDLWTIDLMNKVFYCVVPGGIFVTYSAKGQVRRNLKEVGFEVERIPGPPGKREMLRARKPLI